jgi:hypothetical protein
MRRFIIGLLFGLLAGSLVGYWWLRRIGKLDDPSSFVGQIVKTAREAAAAQEAQLWARYQQAQVATKSAPHDDDMLGI